MLKKKALTAVLTAAMVLGIGGMVTETFSVHEHETGIAHASPFNDRSITPAKAAVAKVAYWRCYWCGKTATTNSYNPGAQVPRAYPPSKSERCDPSHGKGHGWVHTGGVKPIETSRQVLECSYCKKVVTTSRWNGYSRLGCSKNKNGHNWVDTGIVTR